MKETAVREKSFAFALRAVNLAKYLEAEKREFVLSGQGLRSGTAVGAAVRAAEDAECKADFIHKMSIGLKEANEALAGAFTSRRVHRNANLCLGSFGL